MMTPDLGKLERVELREAWTSESGDFTPWLADHLDALAEELGLSLELVGTEVSVGPFSADILCRRMGTDHLVLIENQLEWTDHRHLGQILTYTAGLEALTVIWVAAGFVEQHRGALDWLNSNTPEDVGFYGVEVQLWRIGDSTPAPRFNVASRPNIEFKEARDKAPRGNVWNLSRFLKDLAQKCPDGVSAAQSIHDWAQQTDRELSWGSGNVTGAFVPTFEGRGDREYFPLIVYSNGKVGVEFVNIKVKPVFEDEAMREQLRARLNAIDGVDIPEEKIVGEPYIQLPLLADEARLRQFFAVWDWFADEVWSPDGEE